MVPLEIIPEETIAIREHQNTRMEEASLVQRHPLVEIMFADATIRFFEHVDTTVIESTLKTLGGMCYGR